jgi:hypothetical protein
VLSTDGVLDIRRSDGTDDGDEFTGDVDEMKNLVLMLSIPTK